MAESDQEDDKSGSAGVRGASYPFVSLEEAVGRANVFFKSEGKNAAPVPAAVEHWGYGSKSSGGRQTVSTMLQYGLMRDEGSGGARRVALTPLALDILLHEPQSQERIAALRKAAVKPKLFADLLAGRSASELPSDSTLRHTLITQKNVSPAAVPALLKNFRATVGYAQLAGSATLPPKNPADNVEVEDVETEQIPLGVKPPSAGAARQDTFSLDEGKVVLQWPAQMSATSFEDFKDWIELQLRKIGRTVQ